MFSGMRSTDVVSPAAYFAQASNDIMRASLDTGSDITAVARANDNAATKLSKQQLLNDTAKTLVENKIAFNKKVGKVEDRIGGQIDKINNSTKRMAGFTSLLGTLGTAGVVNQQNIINKEARAEELRIRKEESAAITDLLKRDQPDPQIELLIKQNETFKKQLDALKNSTNLQGSNTSALPSNADPSQASLLSTSSSPGSAFPSDGFRGEVYNYLTADKGLNRNQALGLMANIDRESSFRTNPAGGDGGNSFGMLQWNNTYGRSDIMKQNVPDWQSNWKGQLDHALSQNQLPEYNAATADYLNTNFPTAQAAADSFMNTWEIPADPKAGSIKHSGFLSGYNF